MCDFIVDKSPGLWRQLVERSDLDIEGGALFLDRDGVIVEEVNYLHRTEDLQLIPGAAATISRANAKSIPVVIVTNQSGVGRGYYDWAAFALLQDELLNRLRKDGAVINMILACGYHKDALADYQIENHSWRKPGPGMLQDAAAYLGFNLARSWLVGDALGDIEAARNAGIAGAVHVLTGHGARDRTEALTRRTPDFSVQHQDSISGVSDLVDSLFPTRQEHIPT